MSSEFDPFKYRAKLHEVIDGDTLDMIVDLGFGISKKIRVRLADVDTDEIHFVDHDSMEYHDGMEHKEFALDWAVIGRQRFDGEWPFIVDTEKSGTGKYGRWIAVVSRRSDEDVINTSLKDEFGDDVDYR